MEGATFTVRCDRGVGVLRVDGDLDMATVPGFTKALDDLWRDGQVSVVLELGPCTRMDSTGIGAIVRAMQHLSEGGHLSVARPSWHVQRLLSLSGLDGWLPVHATVERAVEEALAARP